MRLQAVIGAVLLLTLTCPVQADVLDCRQGFSTVCPAPPVSELMVAIQDGGNQTAQWIQATTNYTAAVQGNLVNYVMNQTQSLPGVPESVDYPSELDAVSEDSGIFGSYLLESTFQVTNKTSDAFFKSAEKVANWTQNAPRAFLDMQDGLVAHIMPVNAFRTNALTTMEPILGSYVFRIQVFHGNGATYNFTNWRVTFSSMDPGRAAANVIDGDPFGFMSLGSYGAVDQTVGPNDGDHELYVRVPASMIVAASLNNQIVIMEFRVPDDASEMGCLYSETVNTQISKLSSGYADQSDGGTPTLLMFRPNGAGPLHRGNFTTDAVLGDTVGFGGNLVPYLTGYLPN